MTRIRVSGTVDAAVAVDFDLTVKEFQRQAEKANAPIPTQSDLLQEVIKKGLWQIRKQNAAV
jgi:hypothetical protein